MKRKANDSLGGAAGGGGSGGGERSRNVRHAGNGSDSSGGDGGGGGDDSATAARVVALDSEVAMLRVREAQLVEHLQTVLIESSRARSHRSARPCDLAVPSPATS